MNKMDKEYEIGGRRGRGGSGLQELSDSDIDLGHDRFLKEKTSLAEALIYLLGGIRTLLVIMIILGSISTTALLFLAYKML